MSYNDLARTEAIQLAKSLMWKPYRWGGDDPSGFDCSGYIIELLKSVGTLPYAGDWTAAALFARFQYPTMETRRGDLVFWKTRSGKIVHVEMVYCPYLKLSIGASGGGSKTQTTQDAWDQNAYIKMRPWNGRGREIAGFRDPFKEV